MSAKLYKGTGRLVVIIGPIAVKFARVRFVPVIKGWLRYLMGGAEERSFWRIFNGGPFRSTGVESDKRLLFLGIADNLSEFFFYLRTRNTFLAPTFFSFFGLVNVQMAGRAVGTDGEFFRVWRVWIEEVLGSEVLYTDHHHLIVEKNFCVWRGQLRIVDYGAPVTQAVVTLYGEKIQKGFAVKFLS